MLGWRNTSKIKIFINKFNKSIKTIKIWKLFEKKLLKCSIIIIIIFEES